ncbi:MAG TPA: ABC transporter permease [Acidimicrobiales bacterium]|nr:ABC transporter permease [Acidimicrobiales bacterium]
MSQTATIALLTMREALRRKLIAAFLGITIALVVLSAWGFDRLSHSRSLSSGEVAVSVPQALILFMFMFSFVVALSASTISSPAISAEIESGVLQSVATRPVRRAQILLGKWFGLAAVLAAYAAAVCALELVVVDVVSGFTPPDPAGAFGYLLAEGLVLLTVGLLLSTRLSALATGVVAVALFGAAWLAGVVGAIGADLHLASLREVDSVARYILPTDGLWHGVIYALEPRTILANAIGHATPFYASGPPSWAYLLWCAVWVVAALAVALLVFERREL